MMSEGLFLGSAAVLFTLILVFGWRYLPQDRFQILASVPIRRTDDHHWQGLNLTWYGLLLASAAVIGIAFVLLLTRAAGQPPGPVFVLLLATVGLCVPAAHGVARLVEHKLHTFTIGGAFFCGLAATPLLILLINAVCLLLGRPRLDPAVVLAALAIGYILGEGLGRLACLSFGCCYGKPLNRCGRLVALLLDRLAVVFTAATKKAVYEGGLAGVKLVPVQAMTCLLYTATALASCHLFFHGHYRAAFLASLLVSQVWRVLSEMLRADFRGFTSISAYQKMSLVAILFGLALAPLLPEPRRAPPDIGAGLLLLLDPVLLLTLKGLWVLLFFHFGRSMVTGATLSFQVHHHRI